MEMIAPLAKVLAEANGIDWRRIHGSGTGGQVVEQDILQYLSRIMTGEEEPPATPVDLPPPDWTGDAPSMEALAAAGVDSDIADFVASARSEPVALPTDDFATDAMDFELELDDDNDTDDAATRDPREMAQEPRDADYAGADVIDNTSGVTPITPAPLDPGMPERSVVGPSGGDTGGYVDPAQATPPHVPQEDLGLPQDAPTRRNDPNDGVPSTPDTSEEGWHDRKDEPTGLAASASGVSSTFTGGLLSSLYQSKTPEPVTPAPVQSTPLESHPVDSADFELDEPAPVAATSVESALVTAAVELEVPQAVEVAEPVELEPVAAAPVAPAAVAVEPQAAPAVEVTPAAAAPAIAPVAVAVAGPAASAPRHAALRVSVNATAITAARTDLAEHFGGRAAPLAVFVARAAARHAHTLNLTSVGVYAVTEDVTPIATPNLTGDFRAAVTDLHAATSGTISDLMILDAGELGLDELQLPGEGATLTLGRVKDGQATLTLTGNVNVRAGATFLQSVAELLETPIRLML